MTKSAPVQKRDSSDARYRARWATSDGSPPPPPPDRCAEAHLVTVGRGPGIAQHDRVDRAGADRVHADAVAAPLGGGDPGHAAHRPLAGAVRDPARTAVQARRRRDVDDRSRLLRDHLRTDRLHPQPDADLVDVDHPAVGLLGHLGQRLVAKDGRVVDQHVEPAMLLDDLGHQGVPGRLVADVEVVVARRVADPGRGLGALAVQDIGDDHLRASAANSVASAAPWPRAPPVTIATLSLRRSAMIVSLPAAASSVRNRKTRHRGEWADRKFHPDAGQSERDAGSIVAGCVGGASGVGGRPNLVPRGRFPRSWS